MDTMEGVGGSLGLAPTAFRLLIGVFLGYPVSLFYRHAIAHSSNLSLRVTSSSS